MVIITRGSTQTIPINVYDIDFADVAQVWVSIGQKRYRIMEKKKKKELDVAALEIENDQLLVHLTQEDTFKLREKLPTFIQLKFKLNSGEVVPSEMKALYIKGIINEEEM